MKRYFFPITFLLFFSCGGSELPSETSVDSRSTCGIVDCESEFAICPTVD